MLPEQNGKECVGCLETVTRDRVRGGGGKGAGRILFVRALTQSAGRYEDTTIILRL
jgi:hypothetical protein